MYLKQHIRYEATKVGINKLKIQGPFWMHFRQGCGSVSTVGCGYVKNISPDPDQNYFWNIFNKSN